MLDYSAPPAHKHHMLADRLYNIIILSSGTFPLGDLRRPTENSFVSAAFQNLRAEDEIERDAAQTFLVLLCVPRRENECAPSRRLIFKCAAMLPLEPFLLEQM